MNESNWNDAYSKAMNTQTQAEADVYLAALIDRNVANTELSRKEAQEVERSNLAYWAGYCDNETRERIERLFCCAHPFLGAIAETGPLTATQCLEIGRELGRQLSPEGVQIG